MVRDYLWENICISCPPLKAPKSGGQLSSFQGDSLTQGSGFGGTPLLLLLLLDSSWPPRQSFTLQCQATSSSKARISREFHCFHLQKSQIKSNVTFLASKGVPEKKLSSVWNFFAYQPAQVGTLSSESRNVGFQNVLFTLHLKGFELQSSPRHQNCVS